MPDPGELDQYSVADLEHELKIRKKQQSVKTRAQAALNLLKERVADDTPPKHSPDLFSLTSKSRFSLGSDLDLTASRVPVNVFVQLSRLLTPQHLKDLHNDESTFNGAVLLLRGRPLHDYWFNYYILLRKSNIHRSVQGQATSSIEAPDTPRTQEPLAVPILESIPTDQLTRPYKRARSGEISSQNHTPESPTSSTEPDLQRRISIDPIDKSRAPYPHDKSRTALSINQIIDTSLIHHTVPHETSNTGQANAEDWLTAISQKAAQQSDQLHATRSDERIEVSVGSMLARDPELETVSRSLTSPHSQVEYSSTVPQRYEPGNTIPTSSPSEQRFGHQTQAERCRTGLPSITSIINMPSDLEHPSPYCSSNAPQENVVNSTGS
ncbi:hypothetical protein BDZ45DRAFT_757207 [Acephala macrosclerotiorum]|nr:hypothetical protein BDZ45DRAFT_757207 [Acephala macrosclerotiorum]